MTPCTLHLNVLPPSLANYLLTSLLEESQEWKANKFRMFERIVQTKSSSCLYVDRQDPLTVKEYIYNGSKVLLSFGNVNGSWMVFVHLMRIYMRPDRLSRKL